MPDWKKYVSDHLASLHLSPEREAEMIDEMAQHLEAAFEEALAAGASEYEAQQRAAAHIKDWRLLECELVRSQPLTRKLWTRGRHAHNKSLRITGGLFMGSLIQDARFSVRMLLKNRLFTAVAVLSLAVGIGANTAVYGLINVLLLRMLPVRAPQELVLFSLISPQRTSYAFSYPLYERLVRGDHSFIGLIAASSMSRARLTVENEGAGNIESVQQSQVSGNYFSVLGAEALLGRVLEERDNNISDPRPVAVISYDFWKRRFALDPHVIGTKITLNEFPFTIVGVAQPSFFGIEIGRKPDIWWPLAAVPLVSPDNQSLKQNTNWWLRVIGRLRPEADFAGARGELDVIVKQQVEEIINEQPSRPDRARAFRDMRLELEPGGTGWTTLRQQFKQPLFILLTTVAVVLLTACANVANLLLARATSRKKEIAIRLAIGAGRWRIIRQLLTESLILSLAAGAVGLFFAKWGSGLLLTYLPPNQTVGLDLSPDVRILAFTLAVSVLTGIIFGLVPAFQTTRFDLITTLKNQTGLGEGHSRFFLNKSLVIVQVALSLFLLIGAGLFVRTFQNLKTLDTGFTSEHLVQFGVQIGSGYTTDRRVSVYKEILARLESMPGVQSASLMGFGLLEGSSVSNRIAVPGRLPTPDEDIVCYALPVGPRFSETLGITLLSGRDVTLQDDYQAAEQPAPEGVKQAALPTTQTSAPQSALINQSMARFFFGEENAIGKRFTYEGGATQGGTFEVIGIVRDAKYSNLRDPAPKTFYPSYFQRPSNRDQLFELRTFGDFAGLSESIQTTLQQINPKLHIVGLQRMTSLVEQSMTQERFIAQIASFFSLFALLLASIGLYGIMSNSVSRRTNEIGIRLALGAQRADVIRMILNETLVMVVIGAAIGLTAALIVTRMVSRFLYGVDTDDTTTIVMAITTITVVAFLAAYWPARRASLVDPMAALRFE